jgi:hypothetical protein
MIMCIEKKSEFVNYDVHVFLINMYCEHVIIILMTETFMRHKKIILFTLNKFGL